jgi:hypothetical protein
MRKPTLCGACCRFEGDGMVHAVRIKDGAASYCNHWVRTHKLAEEQRAKFPIYAKVRSGGFYCCGALLLAASGGVKGIFGRGAASCKFFPRLSAVIP